MNRRRYLLFGNSINNLVNNHSQRFIIMSLLTFTMMIVEIIIGIITGSLTLLSDAFHMLSDLIALIIGLIANNLSSGNDFEHKMVSMRYEIVGALINGTILLTSCFIIGLEAIQRLAFVEQDIENINLVIIVGSLGLFINLIGICIFGHSHETKNDESHSIINDEKNLNVHGVFLHLLSDFLGSIVVIISSLIIKFTDGNFFVDPICTLFILTIIAFTAYPLVKQSINILLDKSPFNQEIIVSINDKLHNIDGVLSIHELHCWQVKPGYNMAIVHLVIDPDYNEDGHTDKYCDNECNIIHDKMTIIDKAKRILHKYCIHSSNIQCEYPQKQDKTWLNLNKPCFDYVCDENHCIAKSQALSNIVV